MTWLDLYNYLYEKAHDVNNPDSDFWKQVVMFHNLETGDEHPCDTWEISFTDGKPRVVLGINFEEENA